MISRWTRLRMVLFGALVALGAVAIGRRAYVLQVVQADLLRERAEDQSLRDIEVRPQRGRILDRNGNELASTAELDSVSCNPRVLMQVPGGVARLAGALRLDAAPLARTLERASEARRYFAWIARTVSPEESARVRALALPGVRLTREPARIYPHKELGAPVLGHTNIDGKGVEGVEKAFDNLLRGTAGRVRGVKDGSGRALLIDGLHDPKSAPGEDLRLTLDTYLMHVTQTALSAAVKTWKAKGGSAVVLDPRTGDVLALASVPTYDANNPGDALARGVTRNRAIADAYEPGSTLKTITLAATLDAGLVSPGDRFDCQSGAPLYIGRTPIRDDHPEGVLTAAEVLQRSSNIGTVKIARRLGKQRLHDALLRFGFGRRTGIGLSGEGAGVVHPVHKWGDVHLANIAFGQGLTATPLQMVAAIAALANGGLYKPPRLVLNVIRADGRAEPLPPAAGARAESRVISAETARTMLAIMRGVTGETGTARRAAIPGYEVAGKTGTAQKVVNGRYAAWVASFIGVIPADDPRLVIGIVIDEPEPEHRGGMVAAPAFKQVAQAALQYLAVPPTQAVAQEGGGGGGGNGNGNGNGNEISSGGSEEAETAAALAAAAEIGEGGGGGGGGGGAGAGAGAGGVGNGNGNGNGNEASLSEVETAAALAAAAEIGEGPGSDQPVWSEPEDFEDGPPALGDDDDEGAGALEVANQDERAGGGKGGIVQVPSFVGMTLGEAIRAARLAGVELAPEGSGLAVAQSPAPGRRPRGAICRVSFRPGG